MHRLIQKVKIISAGLVLILSVAVPLAAISGGGTASALTSQQCSSMGGKYQNGNCTFPCGSANGPTCANKCLDGTAAPGGDTSKCTLKCGDGRTITGTDPTQCWPVCTDTNTPAPGGDVNNCGAACTKTATQNCHYTIGGGGCENLTSCSLMSQYVYPFINLLAALVGVAVTASIIIGGIQYGSSAGDPQKAVAAKNRIRNAIVALVVFIFLYALLNFLVPGGIFNKI